MKEHSCIFTIFGATGDLTSRKLLPALYYLEHERFLKENFKIIAVARKEKTDEDYRAEASESVRIFSKRKIHDDVLKKLVSRLYYYNLEFSNPDGYAELKEFIEKLAGDKCSDCERIFYLAVQSSFFGVIISNLKRLELAEKDNYGKPYNRVMFEKPFGYDLKSARELNNAIIKVFGERQIYRIDHYMAKDVMQNHMMQLLTLVAMEAPKSLDADDLRKEKVKVLKSVSKFKKGGVKNIAVTGQYTGNMIDGRRLVSYTNEHEVSKSSKTETFVAAKLEINNKMWKGVPFYLRTGKRLKERATEIVIVYKN